MRKLICTTCEGSGFVRRRGPCTDCKATGFFMVDTPERIVLLDNLTALSIALKAQHLIHGGGFGRKDKINYD